MTKHTERRQQLRRVDDGECLHIAARQVLAAGGSDFAIVDGQAVQITARVLSEEEARRVIKSVAEANHDRTTD